MKLIIIGGGITGIASALYAKKIGFNNIEIYEKSKRLGGILQDFKLSDSDSFLPNCQYFDSKSPIFDVIDKNLFYQFKHSYGSFSNFNQKIITREDFAGPVLFSNGKNITIDSDFEEKDVKTYLKSYPNWISNELINLFQRFSEGESCHPSCLASVQMQRLYIYDRENEILNFKSKNSTYDKIYGLPRKSLSLKETYSCLPIKGFNNLFAEIYKNLLDLNIKVNYSTNLSLNFANNLFELKLKDKTINLSEDYVIWTADPNKFLQLENPPLSYKPIFIINYYFKTNCFIDEPFYIQVFDLNTPIIRIFIYENSIILEALKNNLDEKEIINNALDIISYYKKNFKQLGFFPNKIYKRNEQRFTLFSSEVFSKLKDLNLHSFQKTNLVCTPWHLYSRDLKIKDIFQKLRLIKELNLEI